MPAATGAGTKIVATAAALLDVLPYEQGVRLAGVGLSNLATEATAD
ncbi:MAG: hypothetical protein R2706_18160 [Acidimicrobiales bacterium]